MKAEQRWGARLIPAAELEERWIDRGHDALAGEWFDDALIADWSPQRAARELGLEEAPAVGLVRFPVTAEVLAHSAIHRSRGFGGRLPDPPPGAAWLGSGFAPSVDLIPEYLCLRVSVPDGTELIRWGARRVRVRRWLRGRWVQP